jgi:peptidoglycan/xylan/chitin deacetylase (PgdA/CDA1 family)
MLTLVACANEARPTMMTNKASGRHRIAQMLARTLGAPVAIGVLWLLRLSKRRVGVALMYHAVDEHAGDPDRELVPAVASSIFEGQLRHLNRHYRVVSAGHLLAAVNARRRGARYPAAITFDDDLRSHVAVTLPILQRTGVTATFFLTGVSLERPFSFWWERMARVLEKGPSSLANVLAVGDADVQTSVQELGVAIKQLDPGARAAVEGRLRNLAGPDPPDAGLRTADVRHLVEAQMEIGFHTLQHDNLRLLTPPLLALAMENGRAVLEKIVGEPLRIICYPYGEADERVAGAAREAGFVSGFTAQSGAVTPVGNPLLSKRVSPSHRSAGALAIRTVVSLLRPNP